MACRRSQFALAVALWAAVACAQGPSETADVSAPSAHAPAETPTTQPRAGETVEGQTLRKSPAENKPVGGSGDSGPTNDWLQSVIALAVVVGLILVLRYGLKRYGSRRGGVGPARVFDVLVRTPVGARQQMLLVRVGRRLLVVGAGADGLRTLAEIQDPQEAAELLGTVEQGKANSLTNNFAKLLHGRPEASAEDPLAAADDETLTGQQTSVGVAATRVRGMLDRLRGTASSQGGSE